MNDKKQLDLGGLTIGRARLLEGIKTLQGFRPLQRLMRTLEIDGLRGDWDEATASITKSKVTGIEQALYDLYVELRLFGRKHIFLYRRGAGHVDQLKTVEGVVPTGADATLFPFVPAGTSIPDRPVLCHVRDYEKQRLFVFASPRLLDRSIEFNRDWLRDDAPEDIQKATVKATRKERVIAFDAVVVPLNQRGHFEVRLDHSHSKAEPNHFEARARVLHAFHAARGMKREDNFIGNPVNFATCMHPLYADKKEGRVVELAFACPTETRRREVMHSKGNDDLRKEIYHKKGVSAVGGKDVLDIYRIAIEWQKTHEGEPLEPAYMVLPGTTALLSADPPPLYEVLVPRLTGRTEYAYMMSRLSKHAA